MAVSRFLCPQCQAIGRTSRPIPPGTKLRCRHCGFRFEPAEGLSQLLERDDAFAILEPGAASGPEPEPGPEPPPAADGAGAAAAGAEPESESEPELERATGHHPEPEAVDSPTPSPTPPPPPPPRPWPVAGPHWLGGSWRYALLEGLGRIWLGLAALTALGVVIHTAAAPLSGRLALAAAEGGLRRAEAGLAAFQARIAEERAWAEGQAEPEIRWALRVLIEKGPDPSFFVGDEGDRKEFDRVVADHQPLTRLRQALVDVPQREAEVRQARSEVEAARREAAEAQAPARQVLLIGAATTLGLATVGALLLVINDAARHVREGRPAEGA